MNSALEEFSAQGDVETQLSKAVVESTTQKVKLKQTERRLAKLEGELEVTQEREVALNQVLSCVFDFIMV